MSSRYKYVVTRKIEGNQTTVINGYSDVVLPVYTQPYRTESYHVLTLGSMDPSFHKTDFHALVSTRLVRRARFDACFKTTLKLVPIRYGYGGWCRVMFHHVVVVTVCTKSA